MSKGELIYRQRAFNGIARDFGTGKQPDNTVAQADNVVYDRDAGSLVVRYPNENVLAVPSGASTISHLLSKQVTYPTPTDMLVCFTEDGIYQYPYWHNSSTATTDWKLVTENLTATLTAAQTTINASPTNTIVITGADALGFSQTADYYINWQFRFYDPTIPRYSHCIVKDYAYAAAASGTVTITLDTVIDSAGIVFQDQDNNVILMRRYFHYDLSSATDLKFTPAFTDPDAYSTDWAIRWSGGKGSTVGYKNVKSGYVNRTFFNATTPDYTFTGTYVDQAECFAPASSLLSASTFTDSDVNTNIIANDADKDFDEIGTNWASNGGSFTARIAQISGNAYGGLAISDSSDGYDKVAGTYGSNYGKLTTTYTNALGSSATYSVKIRAIAYGDYNIGGQLKIRFVAGSTYESPLLNIPSYNTVDANNPFKNPIEFEFATGVSESAKPEIQIFFAGIADGAARSMFIDGIEVSLTSNTGVASSKTYKLWASYVYDGFQESELTYLAAKFVTKKFGKISYTLAVGLGNLNKFITGIRLYVSEELLDQTGTTTTTKAPRHLIADIPVGDDATSTWTFNTTTGKYNYASSFNGSDLINKGLTWEQETGRTASISTTCSYSIAEEAAGQIFVSQEYDYAEGREYTNRVRHTGFNGEGAPTPDIFPNIAEKFITTITEGSSQEVKALLEYQGNLRIWKKNSYLNLGTSNPDVFSWKLRVLKDGEGTLSKFSVIGTDKGVVWSNRNGVQFESGGFVKDLTKLGLWKQYYKTLVTSDTIAASQRMWYNNLDGSIGLAYDTNTSSTGRKYLKFYIDTPNPVLIDNLAVADKFSSVQTISTGEVYFVGTGSSYIMKFKDGVSSDSTAVTIDTGYREVEINKKVIPTWVYFVAEGITSGTITATLYGDGSSIVASTKTIPSTGRQFYKFQSTSNIPVKTVKFTLTHTNSDPTSSQFKLIEWGYMGNYVEEYTDV